MSRLFIHCYKVLATHKYMLIPSFGERISWLLSPHQQQQKEGELDINKKSTELLKSGISWLYIVAVVVAGVLFHLNKNARLGGVVAEGEDMRLLHTTTPQGQHQTSIQKQKTRL